MLCDALGGHALFYEHGGVDAFHEFSEDDSVFVSVTGNDQVGWSVFSLCEDFEEVAGGSQVVEEHDGAQVFE